MYTNLMEMKALLDDPEFSWIDEDVTNLFNTLHPDSAPLSLTQQRLLAIVMSRDEPELYKEVKEKTLRRLGRVNPPGSATPAPRRPR